MFEESKYKVRPNVTSCQSKTQFALRCNKKWLLDWDGILWVSFTYLVQTWKFIEELTQLRSQQQQQQTD